MTPISLRRMLSARALQWTWKERKRALSQRTTWLAKVTETEGRTALLKVPRPRIKWANMLDDAASSPSDSRGVDAVTQLGRLGLMPSELTKAARNPVRHAIERNPAKAEARGGVLQAPSAPTVGERRRAKGAGGRRWRSRCLALIFPLFSYFLDGKAAQLRQAPEGTDPSGRSGAQRSTSPRMFICSRASRETS